MLAVRGVAPVADSVAQMSKTNSGRIDNLGLWHVVQAFKADKISKEKRIRSPKTSHSNQDSEH
eukprot:5626329-Karenia_brevis.AAC.1